MRGGRVMPLTEKTVRYHIDHRGLSVGDGEGIDEAYKHQHHNRLLRRPHEAEEGGVGGEVLVGTLDDHRDVEGQEAEKVI